MTPDSGRRRSSVATTLLLAVSLPFWACRCRPPAERPAPHRLKIVTYNIQGWDGVGDGVFEVLRREQPDVVCLQEVIERPAGAAQIDHAAAIGKRLGMHAVSATSLGVPQSRDCDVAILSRFALHDARGHGLDAAGRVFAVSARVDTIGGPLHLISVHTQATYKLDPRHVLESSKTRWRQIARLREIVEAMDGNVVIAGDFNAAPWMPEYALMRSRWTDLSDDDEGVWEATYPASKPIVRIDYVFGRGGLEDIEHAVRALPGSDHLPVVANIEIAAKNG